MLQSKFLMYTDEESNMNTDFLLLQALFSHSPRSTSTCLRASISKDELVERKWNFLLTLNCVCCCHLVLKWEKRAARLVVTD